MTNCLHHTPLKQITRNKQTWICLNATDFKPVSFLQFQTSTSGGHCYLQVVQHGAATRSFAIACGRRQVGHVSLLHVFHRQLVGSNFCSDGLKQECRGTAWTTSLLTYKDPPLRAIFFTVCIEGDLAEGLCNMFSFVSPLGVTVYACAPVPPVGAERRRFGQSGRMWVCGLAGSETPATFEALARSPSASAAAVRDWSACSPPGGHRIINLHVSQNATKAFRHFDIEIDANERKFAFTWKKEKVKCYSWHLTNKCHFQEGKGDFFSPTVLMQGKTIY